MAYGLFYGFYDGNTTPTWPEVYEDNGCEGFDGFSTHPQLTGMDTWSLTMGAHGKKTVIRHEL